MEYPALLLERVEIVQHFLFGTKTKGVMVQVQKLSDCAEGADGEREKETTPPYFCTRLITTAADRMSNVFV